MKFRLFFPTRFHRVIKQRSGAKLALSAILLLLLTLNASAEVLLLRPSTDVRIGPLMGDQLTTTFLSVYHYGGSNVQRTLMRFDLSTLAANAQITTATLKLTADANFYRLGNPTGQPMEIYRVTSDWDPTQVRWIQKSASNSWLNAGGDYVGTTGSSDIAPYASDSSVIPNDFYAISPKDLFWDITSLVKEWHGETQPNYGLILLSYSGNGLHFPSTETERSTPVLQVEFQGPPEITSLTDIRGISTGYSANFKVNAVGAIPLFYQWFKNGNPLDGMTNASFTITNALVEDSGIYSVTVSNSFGTVSRTNLFETWVVPSDTYYFDTIAGSITNSGATDGTNGAARFNNPTSIAVDPSGRLFLTDLGNNTIRMISPEGTNWNVTTIAGLAGTNGTANGTNSDARFNFPDGIVIDPSGNLFVADLFNHAIRKVSPDGTNWVVTTVAGLPGVMGNANGTNSAARFNRPTRLAMDAVGNIFVADTSNSRIRKISQDGTNWVVTTLPGVFLSPNGVAVDAGGNIFVAEWGNHTVSKLTPSGTNWVKTTIAGFPTGVGQPGSADGTTWARLRSPGNLTIDSAGNLYVADSGNRTIRKLIPYGTNWLVTTVGGLPQTIGSTDGLSSEARFNVLYGIAVDDHGNIYISDSGNNTIRRGRLDRGLQITLNDANAVISWPAWHSNAVLEASSDFSITNGWESVNSPVEILGSENKVIVSMEDETRFFRLNKND